MRCDPLDLILFNPPMNYLFGVMKRVDEKVQFEEDHAEGHISLERRDDGIVVIWGDYIVPNRQEQFRRVMSIHHEHPVLGPMLESLYYSRHPKAYANHRKFMNKVKGLN